MNTNTNTNTANPTAKELTQQREQQVWQLRTQCCYSQMDIANELGISQAVVAQILKRVGTRRAEEIASGTDQMIAEQVDQLMHIAMEALNAWKQSKQPSNPVSQNETPPESDSPQIGGQGAGTEGRTPPESTTPEQPTSPPSLRSEIREGIADLDCAKRDLFGVFSAAPRNSRGNSEFGLREARPLIGFKPESGRAGGLGTAGDQEAGGLGKPAYLRTALQALAAVRALRGLNMPYQPEIKPNADSVKMIIGVDLDSMRYKDGTHVSRAEVDRLMGEQ